MQPQERERLLDDFVQMYASRCLTALSEYRGGADEPKLLLLADVGSEGIVPDMSIKMLTFEEARREFDGQLDRPTVDLLYRQLRAILLGEHAKSRCAMCLRFPDGDVLSHVVHTRKRKPG